MRLFIAALLLSACLAETTPYVRTRAAERDEMAWFVDGPPLAITIYNPTSTRVDVWVVCRAENSRGHTDPWAVSLPPRMSTTVLGRVLNKWAYTSPCWVDEWEVVR